MDIYDSQGYRNENKYIFPLYMKSYLEMRLRMFAGIDKYAINGTYTISSIYFDDYKDSAMWDNEEGVDPRSKWRIRAYNHDLTHLTLERKAKFNGMTKKESR